VEEAVRSGVAPGIGLHCQTGRTAWTGPWRTARKAACHPCCMSGRI